MPLDCGLPLTLTLTLIGVLTTAAGAHLTLQSLISLTLSFICFGPQMNVRYFLFLK